MNKGMEKIKEMRNYYEVEAKKIKPQVVQIYKTNIGKLQSYSNNLGSAKKLQEAMGSQEYKNILAQGESVFPLIMLELLTVSHGGNLVLDQLLRQILKVELAEIEFVSLDSQEEAMFKNV